MGAKSGRKAQKMEPEEVVSFVREHKEPAVTASEIAENFGATGRAARYRLKQLEEAGEVHSKKVGSSAKIWYVVG